MKKVCMVVNPAAGVGECMQRYARAREIFKSRSDTKDIEYIEKISQLQGDIPKLVRQAVEEGSDTVVITGGDGSMREAVSELVNKDVNVFLFPFGTGNDFAKFMGLPTEPREAVDRLLSGKAQKIDAAMANNKYFLNVAGVGFDVEVLVNTDWFRKYFKNKRAYMMGLFSAIVRLKKHELTLSWGENKKIHQAMIISVGNGKYIGGGIPALINADIQDGNLDVCVIHDLKKRRIASVLLKFLKGEHVGLPETDYFSIDNLLVEAKNQLSVQLDGEIIEKTPVLFKIVPKAINFIL